VNVVPALSDRPQSGHLNHRRTGRTVAWLLFFVTFLLYAVPSVFLLQAYLQPAFDLAIYDQSLWLLLRGEFFNTVIASHVFGAHFSPILFALSPIAAIPGGAVPELIAQSLIVASGVFPARKLGQSLGKNPLWFMVAYAFHPAIIGGSWYGFRPWNIAVPLLLWAVLLLWEQPTPRRIIVLGLIALLFREDLAIWIGIVAIVLALAGRLKWKALIVPGLALGVATAAVTLLIIPQFSPVGSYFYATATETQIPAVSTILASVTVRILFLMVPLGVLPSQLKWRLAIPLLFPIAGLVIKGGNALTTFFHYDMMFVPVLLLIAGLSPRANLNIKNALIASSIVLVSLGALRPIPPMQGPNPLRFDASVKTDGDRLVDIVVSIEDGRSLSLAAPSRLLPHLSERRNVFIYPSPLDRHQNASSGYQFVDIVEYQCPQPNIVIVDERSGAARWSAALTESYERFGGSGDYSVWRRNTESPDTPCSAIWQASTR